MQGAAGNGSYRDEFPRKVGGVLVGRKKLAIIRNKS